MITVAEAQEAEDTQRADGEGSPGRRKKILVVLVAAALVAAGAWFFLLRGGGGQGEPEPGEILALDSTQINLADGHYLKIGIALQLVAGAHEVEGSKALDATIELFSGRDVADLTKAEGRQTLKHKLAAELEERYHGDVMEVYFTEFVTQ